MRQDVLLHICFGKHLNRFDINDEQHIERRFWHIIISAQTFPSNEIWMKSKWIFHFTFFSYSNIYLSVHRNQFRCPWIRFALITWIVMNNDRCRWNWFNSKSSYRRQHCDCVAQKRVWMRALFQSCLTENVRINQNYS